MSRPDLLAMGAEIHDALAAACARAGTLRGMALLAGPLESARISPGPDADALALTGPLYLVQGTALISPGGISLYGVISWEDQGLPRMVAGRIEAAVGAGVVAARVGEGSDAEDEDEDDEAEARPARSVRGERPATERAVGDGRSPLVDLAPEMSALRPRGAAPAPREAAPRGAAPREAAPREAAPRSTTARLSSLRPDDGARAAAKIGVSKAEPAIAPKVTPAAAPKPTAGGWAAAVAASSRSPAPREAPRPKPGGAPAPDELGFEDAPALRIGDVLVHPRFGACVVSQVSGRDRVKVRRQTGASFDLALAICRFVRESDDAAGRRVFRLLIEQQ